jgi:hypothetical protein
VSLLRTLKKPVQMIAISNEIGGMVLIRFKAKTKDMTEMVITVDKIILSKIEKFADNVKILYKCRSIINDKGVNMN